MTQPPQAGNPPDDDLPTDAEWAALEKAWRASLPTYTDEALLDIFPEARAVIPDKIAEWQQVRAGLIRTIKRQLAIIKEQSAPEHQPFWRDWVKWTTVPRLRTVNEHLARLKRLQRLASNLQRQGQVNAEHIAQARRVPLETLVTTPLRRRGKALVGRCPLHQEKTPSFHLYPATNSWYCYGCRRGGDSIAFIRAQDGLSFIEAVRALINI